MFFHRTNGIGHHARWLGDPAKPLVVFSNSLGTDSRIWDAVLPDLTEAFAVLLYDSRGHGLSDCPQGPYRIETLAADLLGLVDRVTTGPFALIGLSVGGMVAQCVAAAHPYRVQSLVLCDTAHRIGEARGWNNRIEQARRGGLESLAEPVLERWFTQAYREREAATLNGWRAMLTRQPVEGYIATCAAIRDADLAPVAASITVPTLCVVGDSDLSTPPDLVRELAGLIPGAELSIIADAGHLPCIEQPQDLTRAVVQHFRATGYGTR